MANTLDTELRTYGNSLHELIADTGKFVVVKGEEIVGVYDTYEDALKVGISKFGLDSFLVKQIAPTEQIHSFTRNYDFVCQA